MAGCALSSRGHLKGRGIVPGFMLTAFLVVWMQRSLAQIIFKPGTVSVIEDGTVTLKPLGIKTIVDYCSWFRGTVVDDENLILTYAPNIAPFDGEKYTGRETVLIHCGLRISSVLRNYSGDYTIEIKLQHLPLQRATVRLSVTGGVALPAPPTVMIALILLAISSFLC